MAVSTSPTPEKGAANPSAQAQSQAQPSQQPPEQKPQPKPVFTDYASI